MTNCGSGMLSTALRASSIAARIVAAGALDVGERLERVDIAWKSGERALVPACGLVQLPDREVDLAELRHRPRGGLLRAAGRVDGELHGLDRATGSPRSSRAYETLAYDAMPGFRATISSNAANASL